MIQRLTVLVGVILVAVGAAGYFQASPNNGGPLLLAGVGAALIVFGWAAAHEKIRMHAMHAAVLAGLIGLIGGIVTGMRGSGSSDGVDTDGAVSPESAGEGWPGWVAAAVCGVYVILCVRSFVLARRARSSPEEA